MNILLWHVHGSWTTAFVQGGHRYLLPTLPERGPDGLGRARTWDWPASAVEISVQDLHDEPIDVVVLQRPHEIELVQSWTGRRVGRDLPAVYVEHNAPTGAPTSSRHPLADRGDIPLVHVTHFNELFWDSGRAPTTVIEHGVLDPGELYTGELERLAVVSNDPGPRGRIVGSDLIEGFARELPLDLFGMRVDRFAGDLRAAGADVTGYEDLPQAALHRQLASRRAYLHLTRWTSLGLSLIEAMMLGLPVVVLATTEAVSLVDASCGAISTDVSELRRQAKEFVNDQEHARVVGKAARRRALDRHGIDRFLADWDELLSHSAVCAFGAGMERGRKRQ